MKSRKRSDSRSLLSFSVVACVAILTAAATFAQTAPATSTSEATDLKAPQVSSATARPGVVSPNTGNDISGNRGAVLVDAPAFSEVGVLLKPNSGYPSAAVQTGTSDANSAFKVFNSGAGPALFSVFGNGNAGLGTTNPVAKLHVQGGGTAQTPLWARTDSGGALLVSDISWWLGPTAALVKVEGFGVFAVGSLQMGHGNSGVIHSGSVALELNPWVNQPVTVGNAAYANSSLRVLSTGVSSFAGPVTIAGNLTVDGNVTSKYQDVAEWVPSLHELAAGTVVVLDREHSNHVVPSSRGYDTTVAGVVSERPGLALGVPDDSKALIATTGRVRVRVDATKNPVAIGDLLVTGEKPGMAMKSVPLDLSGVAIHRPGTVLGKALEPLQQGEGEILVLLSLQ